MTDIIKKAYLDTPVDLEKMFEDNGDPFEVDEATRNLQNTTETDFADEETQASTANSDMPY